MGHRLPVVPCDHVSVREGLCPHFQPWHGTVGGQKRCVHGPLCPQDLGSEHSLARELKQPGNPSVRGSLAWAVSSEGEQEVLFVTGWQSPEGTARAGGEQVLASLYSAPLARMAFSSWCRDPEECTSVSKCLCRVLLGKLRDRTTVSGLSTVAGRREFWGHTGSGVRLGSFL